VISHAYYQWVPYVFVLLGLMCMVPHYVWKSLEEGKMAAIADGVSKGFKEKDEEAKKLITGNLIKYIVGENRTSHKKYAYGYLFSLFLNVVTSCSVFGILNKFINGRFDSLGTDFLRTTEKGQFLKEIFPRLTSCVWITVGSGGGQQVQHHMCLLSLNIIIEKIFVFLWFWLIFLIITSLLNFLYYALMIFSKNTYLRQHFLAFAVRTTKKKIRWEENEGTIDREKRAQKNTLKYLKTLNSEDFLFLYGIGRNVDSSTLNMVLQALAEAKKSELGEKQETRFRSVGEEENIHKKGKLSLMIPK